MLPRPTREVYPARQLAIPAAMLVHGEAVDGLAWAAGRGAHPSLVYLDPPYLTGRTFHLTGQATVGDQTIPFARVAYVDRDANGLEGYLDGIRPVLTAAHTLLVPDGSVLVHTDHRVTPYLAVLLDGLFGLGDRWLANSPGFRNELVWTYGLGGSSRRVFSRKHDTILWYSRSDTWFFDPPMVPATSQRLAGQMKKATDVLDIPAINNQASERTGYPTQKPLALLRLLINALCPPGALVADPYGGSGTTALAAVQCGRAALSIDRGDDAIHIQRQRLLAHGGAVEVVRLLPDTPVEAATRGVTVTRLPGGGLQIQSPTPLVFVATGTRTDDDTFAAQHWWHASRRRPDGTLTDALHTVELPAAPTVLWRNLEGAEGCTEA